MTDELRLAVSITSFIIACAALLIALYAAIQLIKR